MCSPHPPPPLAFGAANNWLRQRYCISLSCDNAVESNVTAEYLLLGDSQIRTSLLEDGVRLGAGS